MAGRVTALPGYIDAEIPILAKHASGYDKLDILIGSKYGYAAFGTGIITSDKVFPFGNCIRRTFVVERRKELRPLSKSPAARHSFASDMLALSAKRVNALVLNVRTP